MKKIDRLAKMKPVMAPDRDASALLLDLNESYWFWDDGLKDALIDKIKDELIIERYPSYRILYKYLSEYTGFPEENLLLTNGSDQAISFISELFTNKRQSAIVPSPTFLVYPYLFRKIGVRAYFPVYKAVGNKITFPTQETLSLINKHPQSSVFLCNPNNPIGEEIPSNILKIIISTAMATGSTVIIDEAYFEYGGNTSAEIIKDKNIDNLIILRSFSKAFGMPGVRLGYVIASKNIISALRAMKLPWNVNHFANITGVVALTNMSDFHKKIGKMRILRKHVVDCMMENGMAPYKSVANFITVPHESATEIVTELKKKYNIHVKDISGYPNGGDLLQSAFRMTVPGPNDIDYFINSLISSVASV